MVTLLDLPRELLDGILLQAVLVRGVKMGLRLRLVNKRFAVDVKQALFVSRLLDETKCRDPSFLKAYFIYQIFSDRKNTIAPLRAIRRIAEIVCEEAGQSGEGALTNFVEALCSLTIREGRVNYDYDSWSKITQHDEDFENHILVASAYMNCLPLLERLLAKRAVSLDDSLLFGRPAQAAALQGNNNALELVLKSDRKSNNVWAGKGAVANGHFSTLDLLLEPRWELKQMRNYHLNKSVLRGLVENNSIAMFTRAFPLIGDYEPDPRCPGSPIGHFLKCVVERGYVMLALHLIRLGAPLTGYCSFTSGEDNPLWTNIQSDFSFEKAPAQTRILDIPFSCPLQVAAARGHLGIVRTLLKFGADVDRASKDGPPPIVYAIKLEHVAIFQLLKVRGADITSPRVSRIAFDLVARNGLESMAEMLLREGAVPTSKAVTIALEHGHHGVAKILSGHLMDETVDIVCLWDSE